ncbi:MAG: hypothetical protein WBW85_18915 [Terriglobales bacterium]
MLLNRFFASSLLLLSSLAFAQAPQIKSGSTVYIEPMGGYETYLAAAFTKKHVPLIVVADKDKAEYIITSTVSHRTPSQPAEVVSNTTNVNSSGNDAFNNGFNQAAAARAARGATSASISVVDAHSSQIVFAYAVGKAGNTNQIQSTAEACAKHLKESIEKPKK